MRRGVDLQLAPAIGEEITVLSDAPLVSRYEIGATSSLESDVAENLPFRSRMYASTVRMLPGVISIAGTGAVPDEDMAPAMNGGTISETAGFIEGVDTSITRRGGELRFPIPISAVSETRIESAGFGAEYGRAISGVINTTIKTGTNDFHGEGLYVAQNTKWRAAYDELDIPRPDRRDRQLRGESRAGLSTAAGRGSSPPPPRSRRTSSIRSRAARWSTSVASTSPGS